MTQDVDASAGSMSTRFLSIDKKSADRLISLREYCNTYGRMSDTVTLTQSDEHFIYLHLSVVFDGENVNCLCCPEDVRCRRMDAARHANNECCQDCSAPVCIDCWKHVNAESPSLPAAALATLGNYQYANM